MNTLFALKRLIGHRFKDEVVQRDMSMVPYKIISTRPPVPLTVQIPKAVGHDGEHFFIHAAPTPVV